MEIMQNRNNSINAPLFRQRNAIAGQRGVTAIMVALSMAVMIGFAGLAIDVGRMYVSKSELQTAADSCALAASAELTCSTTGAACGSSYLLSAENAGITVGNQNKKNFQGTNAAIVPADIRFNTALSPNANYLSRAGGADQGSRFAMCIARQTGIVPWFMQLVGVGTQTVTAQAVATLAPGQTANAVPLGVCAASAGSPPNYGMTVGNWYGGLFTPSGAGAAPACSTPSFVGAAGCSGSFNWIDFTPPSGGASELAAILSGTGAYSLPPAGTLVGETGFIASLAMAYNTRFGLYTGPYGGSNRLTASPPDHTGYGYTPTNWPNCRNALTGTPGGASTATNYNSKRASNAPYGTNVANGNTITGLGISNAYNPIDGAAALALNGKDRRLVVAPLVNCNSWCGPGATSNTVPVLAYACVFLLHPMDGSTVRMEYRGRADSAGSPCGTGGAAGGTTGPLVPTLVQ